MPSHRLNYAVVGIFVIAMLASAVVAAMLLTGRSIARDSYLVVFDNVADLKFGTQVRFEGYPVGQVEAIKPLVEADVTRFAVEVSVERGWRIPADSVARIGATTFLGAKTVEIQRGTAPDILVPGDRIAGAPPADMFAAVSGAAASVGNLASGRLGGLLERITDLVETANNLVETDLRSILGQVGGTAAKLDRQVPAIAGELLAFTQQLNAALASMRQVLSQQNIASVGRVIGNVEVTSRQLVEITGDVQSTLGRLDDLLGDFDRIVAANEDKVDAAVEDARYTLQAIAQNVDAINHNLAGTARNMNEFSRLIRQNPGLLLDSSPRPDVANEPVLSLSRSADQ